MEKEGSTPEEVLRKIIDKIIEEKSEYISVSKLMGIIGIKYTPHKRVSKSFMPRTVYKEFHKGKEYRENYIS